MAHGAEAGTHVREPDRDKYVAGVRELFRVAKLVPERQDVVAISPGTSVRDALFVMAESGFSQLPVMASGTVIGVFSHRSFSNGLGIVRKQDDPYDAPVDDFCEDLVFVRASEEVGEILAPLDRDGAILIGDEKNLVAVATATDVIGFLWEATWPFVLLRDIELAIRDLIIAACPSETELARRIANASSAEKRDSGSDLHELTLGDLLGVLLNRENFRECFHHTFGPNRDLVNSALSPTREIRNKIVHFRGEVTTDELDVLMAARRLMLRKVLTVQAQ